MTCLWDKYIKLEKIQKQLKIDFNYSRIKIYLQVIKANLKIKLNIPFNFAIPRPFHLFLWALFRFKSKTIYKGN